MVSQLFVLNSLITRAVLDCNFLVKYYQHVKDLSHIWSSPIVFRVLCPFENMWTKNNQTYEQLKKTLHWPHLYTFFCNFVTKLPRRQFLIHAPLFSLKNGFLLTYKLQISGKCLLFLQNIFPHPSYFGKQKLLFFGRREGGN